MSNIKEKTQKTKSEKVLFIITDAIVNASGFLLCARG